MIFHRMSSIFLYKKAEVFLLPFFFCFLAAEWRIILRVQIGKNMTVSLCVGAQCALRLYVCN